MNNTYNNVSITFKLSNSECEIYKPKEKTTHLLYLRNTDHSFNVYSQILNWLLGTSMNDLVIPFKHLNCLDRRIPSLVTGFYKKGNKKVIYTYIHTKTTHLLYLRNTDHSFNVYTQVLNWLLGTNMNDLVVPIKHFNCLDKRIPYW